MILFKSFERQKSSAHIKRHATVAQLVEQLIRNKVVFYIENPVLILLIFSLKQTNQEVFFMSKIKMRTTFCTFEECFERFLIAKKAKGLATKTLQTYQNHYGAISKYLLPEAEMDTLSKDDIEGMLAQMRDKGLSSNSIASYTRTLRSFLSWCNDEDITQLNCKQYKAEETVKDTYTDKELARLLKKPNMRQCTFSEYRNWVMVNLLLNCGLRAATMRMILVKDVNLKNQTIVYRHTKNKSIQIAPLCSEMVHILHEYLKLRQGKDNEVLFPSDENTPFTESGLHQAIAKYNKNRGVSKTSIHLFRHTYAERFLQNGGSPFELQKILGHSTLAMTRHYCKIYDYDIVRKYNELSPLATLKRK